MPTSFYQAIPAVLSMVADESPASILDLGVGFGKYGALCREVLDIPYERYQRDQWRARIDGVEGWTAYRNPIHDYAYNQVHYGRIQDVLDGLGSYDVVLLIDVLEHFPKDEGRDLIRRILQHTNKSFIISTPVAPAEQAEYLGNSLEHHESVWRPEDFVGYGAEVKVLRIGGNGAVLAKLRPAMARAVLLMMDAFRSAGRGDEAGAAAGFDTAEALVSGASRKVDLLLSAKLALDHEESTAPGRPVTAEAAFTAAEKGALHALGAAWYQQGRFEDAVELFARLAAVDPADAETWLNLAVLRAESRAWPEALSALEHSCRAEGMRHHCLSLLGAVLANLGHTGAAKRVVSLLEQAGEPVPPGAGELRAEPVASRDSELPDWVERVLRSWENEVDGSRQGNG